ncbi:MAG TPA: histidine kinase [Longimicrobiales bacterium]|nr:histidine kinase [Longimicrobiales bacterium]
MEEPRPRRTRFIDRRVLVVGGAWFAVALFSAAQIWIARAALGDPPPITPLLILELPIWAFWALLTVPIVALARRFPLDRTRVLRSVLVHTLAAITIAVVSVAFKMVWYQTFNPYPLGGDSATTWFWQYFRQSFIVGFVIYWAVIGVYHAFTNYFLYRERELEASRAREQLTEARLQTLRMQLHPHFLFNTLNSVSALLEDQPGEARRVIAQLADLLRASLRSDALHVIALEDELQFLRRYMDIEQIRFGDRLDVDLRIDPATRRAAIPSFLFQPLVENAIRHGVAHRESDGRLWISAERHNGALVIHVMDNGPGMPQRPVKEGVGLANTRRRLEELYGSGQSLSLDTRDGGGVDVRVEIPFRVLEGAG